VEIAEKASLQIETPAQELRLSELVARAHRAVPTPVGNSEHNAWRNWGNYQRNS